MAGIIYDLASVLDDQRECYEGLNTLATYKTDAIVHKNLELLTEIMEREEAFIGRLGILEKRRESLLKDISLVTGLDYQEITVSKIIEKIGKELEISERLNEVKGEILKLAGALEKQNQLNQELIKESLEFVNFSVNALQSTQIGMPASYQRPGEAEQLEAKSFFDKKQ